MRRRAGLIFGILVLVVLFFALNMLANVGLRNARLDLTEDHVFTLTQGSKSIAASFDPKEPIKLTLYFSSKLAQGQPLFQSYFQRVREVLEEYARGSKGAIKLTVVDPEPFSDAEDKAAAAGLVGNPINAAGENVYFGLVGTNSVDTQEVIPIFVPAKERFLEYDISRLLYSLGHPKKKVVGLISSLQIAGGFTFDQRTRQPQRTPAWSVIDEARQTFEVRLLGTSLKSIADDVDVLMLVHPKKLDDQTLYAIDQFVLKGGKLLAFVDPLAENDEAAQGQQVSDRASNLTKLLDAWGVEVVPGMLAADKDLCLQVNVGTQQHPEVVPFVVWLHLKAKQLTRDDPITGQLNDVNLGTAGIIRAKQPPAPPAGSAPPPTPPHATISPLAKTTAAAMLMPAEAMGAQPDPKTLLKLFTPGTEELVLAARLTGEVPSAFPNGAPPPPPADPSQPPPPAPAPGLTKSNGPINVILIADTDMLADGLWVQKQNLFGQTMAQKFADNGDMVLNALDNLSSSNDLMSVRARKAESRPFERVEEIRRNADARSSAEREELEKKIEQTKQKLTELQAKKGDDRQFVRSPEQQKAIEDLQNEFAATNKQLRSVRLSLNKDIDTLGTKLKFINIGLVPAVVSIGALGLGALRASRRRRAPTRTG